MMRLTVSCAVLSLFAMACGPVPGANNPRSTTASAEAVISLPLPGWVDDLIQKLEKEPVTSPPSEIVTYQYKSKTVYFQPAHCCDIASTLYDDQGNVLCNPDGAWVNPVDSQCPDFFATAQDPKTIWQDQRTTNP